MAFDGYTSVCYRANDHFVKQVIVETTALDGCLIRNHLDEIVFVKFGAGAEILHAAQELLSGLRLLVFCEVLDKVTMLGFIHPARSPANFKAMTDGYLDRKHIDNVDFMKIDVEGGEAETFRGADRLLGRPRPSIICEVLDRVTRPWGYPAREIINRLRTYDYEWFDILADGTPRPHHPKEEYMEVKNYLAVPREKRSLL